MNKMGKMLCLAVLSTSVASDRDADKMNVDFDASSSEICAKITPSEPIMDELSEKCKSNIPQAFSQVVVKETTMARGLDNNFDVGEFFKSDLEKNSNSSDKKVQYINCNFNINYNR